MIELKAVTKKYGKQTVVDALSLVVAKGSVFGFLGQNGAGKTTTMKMLVGLTLPEKGTLTIEGENPSRAPVREKIGFMPEAPYFYERLTGLEFMKFSSQLFHEYQQKPKIDLEEVLKKVNIYEARNKKIQNYSKGMKQRLAFAQALINDPEYLFLDEPLEGLDPLGRKEIKLIIKDLHREGKTIFFNSHILYDVEELCDHIGIIDVGKLIYVGGVREFCQDKPLEDRFVEIIEVEQQTLK